MDLILRDSAELNPGSLSSEEFLQQVSRAQSKGDCMEVLVQTGRQDDSDPSDPDPPYYYAPALLLPGGAVVIDVSNEFLP
jgi:2-iminoacetate synthase ThiH